MKIQLVLIFLLIVLTLDMRVVGEEQADKKAANWTVELEVKPVKISYLLGEEIPVSFKIKNTSQVTLDILFEFDVKGITPPKGRRFFRGFGKTVELGKEYQSEYDLAEYVGFPGPGEVEITYVATIGSSDDFWGNKKLNKPAKPEPEWLTKTGSFKLKIEKNARFSEKKDRFQALSEKDIEMTITQKTRPAFPGEDVWVLVTISNKSNSEIACHVSPLAVFIPRNKKISPHPKSSKGGLGFTSGGLDLNLLTLKPRESGPDTYNPFNLKAYFTFEKPGAYIIDYTVNLRVVS